MNYGRLEEVLEKAAEQANWSRDMAIDKAMNEIGFDLMNQSDKLDTRESTPRKGSVGDKLASGEIVLTATGRKTTPFPKIATDTDRKATATFKRVDAWLIENARLEAAARNDKFNLTQFGAINTENPTQSDKDSAEIYLFAPIDEQPSIPRPILHDLVARPVTRHKVGDRQTISSMESEVAAIFSADGVDYELYRSDDGRGAMRVFDYESGNVAGIQTFSTFKAAELKFKTTIKPLKGEADNQKAPTQTGKPETDNRERAGKHDIGAERGDKLDKHQQDLEKKGSTRVGAVD